MPLLDPEKSEAEDFDLNELNEHYSDEDPTIKADYQHPDDEPDKELKKQNGSELKDKLFEKGQDLLREGEFKEGSLLEKAQRFQNQFEKAREDIGSNFKNTASEIFGKKGVQESTKAEVEAAKDVKNAGKAVQEGSKMAQNLTKSGAKTAAAETAEAGTGEAAAVGAGEVAGAATATEVGAEAGAAAGPLGIAIGAALGFLAINGKRIWEKYRHDIVKYTIIGFFVITLFLLGTGAVIAGKTIPLTPSNANEKQAATAVAAEAGDSQSLQQITDNVVQAQQARYQIIEGWVGQNDSGDLANLKSQVSQINSLMNQTLAQTNAASKQKTIDQLIGVVSQTDNALPFGTEIAKLAKADVGKSDKNFCNVSSAFSSNPCTNFIYDVLYQAGVPGVLVTTDTDLWNDPSLTKVVARASSLSTTTPPVSELQPGDIIFFGDGTYSTSSNPNPIFDHAGIYIGNNQMIDSNSNTGLVTQESMMVQTSSGNYAFNGAERYGK